MSVLRAAVTCVLESVSVVWRSVMVTVDMMEKLVGRGCEVVVLEIGGRMEE